MGVIEYGIGIGPVVDAPVLLGEDLQPPRNPRDAGDQCIEGLAPRERSVGPIQILELRSDAKQSILKKRCAESQDHTPSLAIGKDRVDFLGADVDTRIALKPVQKGRRNHELLSWE